MTLMGGCEALENAVYAFRAGRREIDGDRLRLLCVAYSRWSWLMNNERSGLCGLRIGNFKAFGEVQQIPVRPLTFIYGANSSGKSSIIHSLLLANNALEDGNVDAHKTRIGGDAVDLGGFPTYIHGHDVTRCFKWHMEFKHKPMPPLVQFFGGFSRTGLQFEIGMSGQTAMVSKGLASVEIQAIDLELDGSRFMRIERGPSGRLYAVDVETNHPALSNYIEKVVDDLVGPVSMLRLEELLPDNPEEIAHAEALWKRQREEAKGKLLSQSEEIRKAIQQSFSRLPFSVDHFLPESLIPEGEENDYAYTEGASDKQAALDSFSSDYEGASRIARILRMEIEALFKVFHAGLKKRLQNLCYLGPLRCYPPRHLTGMHDQDPNWSAGGGQAWERLRREPSVLEKVNHWLTSQNRLAKPYRLVVRHLLDVNALTATLQARLEDAMGKLSRNPETPITGEVESAIRAVLTSHGRDLLSTLILQDASGTQVSHRDVGQGISQVLPVLVHAFALERHIVAIEQPELHLHPALQAELGDVFIDSALAGQKNTFLIESHSEHLLLRIMRRIRETQQGLLAKGSTPVRPEDVAVLYVEPVGSRSLVREMPLNEHGELIKDWPGGFFEEGLREVLI
jgi:hypothetical protein